VEGLNSRGASFRSLSGAAAGWFLCRFLEGKKRFEWRFRGEAKK
jgi:hypothetical protein